MVGFPRHLLAVAAALFVSACLDAATVPPSTRPGGQPATSTVPSRGAVQSAASAELARYYARVQAELLTQGLLRTDGGGPDTPFDADIAVRNFEKIAFFDEYERGGGLRAASGASVGLRRWPGPVRFGIEFGASVDPTRHTTDRQAVTNYVQRLANLTRHPMTAGSAANANFHVLIMGEDDRSQMLARVQSIVPNIDRASLGLLQSMPRGIHCLVMAFAGPENDFAYTRAIAVIRAEHPDLLRLSCVHEELAQGLGLANDSPAARPSIFNDDDEFALLTTQDQIFLRMLYDPRLYPGMSLRDAHPIIIDIANGLVSGPS